MATQAVQDGSRLITGQFWGRFKVASLVWHYKTHLPMPCYFWVVASKFLVNWLAGDPHIFCMEDVFPKWGQLVEQFDESGIKAQGDSPQFLMNKMLIYVLYFCKCSTFLWFLVEVDSRKNLLIIEHIAMDNCTFIDEKDDDLPIARWFSFIFRRIPFKISRRYNQSERLSMAESTNTGLYPRIYTL